MTTPRRMRAAGCLLLVCALVVAACGSRVGRDELGKAQGRLVAASSPASASRTDAAGDGLASAATAGPGAAGAGGTVAGGSATASAPSSNARPATGAAPRNGPGGEAAFVPAGRGVQSQPGAVTASGSPSAPGTPTMPAPGAPVVPATKPPLLLGSFGTGSGPVGAQVAAIPPATRAWAEDLNTRGGLAGHVVKVIFGDDGGDPGRALAVVKRMVEVDKVVAFVATYSVTTMEAVAPYLEQHGVPVIGATGGSAVEDTSPMIFNPTLGADYGIAWSYLLAITAQTDRRQVSLLYCFEASTCPNQARRVKELAGRLGVKVVHEAQVSIVQPDYTAEVLAARNAGAEVVVGIIDAASMIRIIGSAHRQGWEPLFSATHNLNTGSFRSTSVELEGTLAASATLPYTTSPKLAPYLEAMKRFAPDGIVGGYGASAWAHGKLVEALGPALAGDHPTSAHVVDALHGLRGETLGGLIPPVTFNRGPHAAVNLCVVPLRYQRGMFRPKEGPDGRWACPPGFVAGDPAASQPSVS